MVEEWRSIPDFPDYAVSSEGRVKRVLPDRHGRIISGLIKPVVRPDGYLVVSLHRNTKQSVKLVHRIVCAAFHGPSPSNEHHAAHGDGDKGNNRAENIRWASPVENNADKRGHGTVLRGAAHPARIKPAYLPRGSAHKNSKLTEEMVLRIRSDSRPQKIIAAEFGVTQSLISMVRTRKIWAHVEGATS